MNTNHALSFAFHRYKPAAWLRVTGADAAAFLQGQFTQDLRDLAVCNACYGMFLTPKGKAIADSFILKGDANDEFWVFSYFSPAETIRQRLDDFIVADEVAIADETSSRLAVALMGEGSGSWLKAAPRKGVAFPGRRGDGESWEWVFPADEAGAVAALLAGAVERSAMEMERARIAAGIAAVPRDIGPETCRTKADSTDRQCPMPRAVISGRRSWRG